jgi:transcriptional regulator with XRE-family HTH domain
VSIVFIKVFEKIFLGCILMNFGKQLKDLRNQKGLKQTDMAALLGITVRAYQNYELEAREPSLSVLIALADFFDVSLDYLVGRDR